MQAVCGSLGRQIRAHEQIVRLCLARGPLTGQDNFRLPLFSRNRPGYEGMVTSRKPGVSDDLTNELAVRCPRCQQTYRLGYSDTEWHRVKDWLQLAAKAIRKDHDLRHEAAIIPLGWRGVRRR